jgi:hypothetical protein
MPPTLCRFPLWPAQGPWLHDMQSDAGESYDISMRHLQVAARLKAALDARKGLRPSYKPRPADAELGGFCFHARLSQRVFGLPCSAWRHSRARLG